MKRSTVQVPWPHGLHFRPAARLVRLAQGFRSEVILRVGRQTANLRSFLSVVSLCAIVGTSLEIEVSGDDEEQAIRAVEQAFTSDDDARSVS